MARIPTTYDFVGSYGRNWLPGVLAEHAERFVAAGGRLIAAASGTTWAVTDDGFAHRLVCGDVIEVPTEDGPVVGRCGLPVDEALGGFACTGHAEERNGWLAMTEAERAAWERHAYQ